MSDEICGDVCAAGYPLMPYTEGQDVEVKVGGSLGRWVPGTVVGESLVDDRHTEYLVLANGAETHFREREIRRPRNVQVGGRAMAAVKKAKPKRNDQASTGRGPLRFPEYRRWVKTKPCLFCFANVVDPHHYGPKGLGQTTDDTRLTPVCRQAHDALHHRRVDELCRPTAYLRHADASFGPPVVDMEHSWAIVEAHVYRVQGDVLAEFIRIHGELR